MSTRDRLIGDAAVHEGASLAPPDRWFAALELVASLLFNSPSIITMKCNLTNILVLLISSAALPHTAFAAQSESGVTCDYDSTTMNKPTIKVVAEADDSPVIGDTLSTEDRIEDTTAGGGGVASQKHLAHAVSYKVTCAAKAGQTIYVSGSALVQGSISAEMTNAHGHAAAAAEGEVEIKILDDVALAKKRAALAIAHAGAVTGGAGFSFHGWGGSWSVTLKEHGTEAQTAQLADTDATMTHEANQAIVNVNWAAEHALQIAKTTGSGNDPAEGSASAEVEAIATIEFTLAMQD